MATNTVDDATSTPIEERIELAVAALNQAAALLPIAQELANKSGDECDAVLGLLGRVVEMNHAALNLLLDPSGGEHGVRAFRVDIFGSRLLHDLAEVRHG